MSEVYSPNLFLFQSFIEEVVKEGKKHIRTTPFDIEPECSLQSIQHSSPMISRRASTCTTPTSWLL